MNGPPALETIVALLVLKAGVAFTVEEETFIVRLSERSLDFAVTFTEMFTEEPFVKLKKKWLSPSPVELKKILFASSQFDAILKEMFWSPVLLIVTLPTLMFDASSPLFAPKSAGEIVQV